MSEVESADGGPRGEALRRRILTAAADLIAEGGLNAVTTRAVADAASVQAPAIYRVFGDKRGLLDAVARQVLADHVARKAAQEPHEDPVQDLIAGWDAHMAFALAHPDVFAIMNLSPDETGEAEAGLDVLRRRIARVAAAGRLKMSEARAMALVQAVFVGTALSVLGRTGAKAPADLPDIARDSVMAALVGDTAGSAVTGVVETAVALRARLGEAQSLSDGERRLLAEWLDRIAEAG